MNDETRPVTGTISADPQVRAFVAAVRSRLGDLTADEREELVGGLEADVLDLVAERGVGVLPDPTAYAAELRAAAGFTPHAAPVSSGPGARAGAGLTAWLDRCRDTWTRWVDTGDHLGIPELLETLRPVWWVLRALCAAALLAEVYGSQGVFGLTPARGLLGLVAILVSVQIGRGVWWPGTRARTSLLLRTALIGLNVFAVLVLPVLFGRFLSSPPGSFVADPVYAAAADVLSFDNRSVRNVYPYDAAGRPLTGVQLVDQDGRRLPVATSSFDDSTGGETLLSPWLNGRTKVYSTFPLPEQSTDPASGEPIGEARLQTPPFASLPPVTLAGVRPSVVVSATTLARLQAAATAYEKGQAKMRQNRANRTGR